MGDDWRTIVAAVVVGAVMATAALAQTTPGAGQSGTPKPSAPSAATSTPPSSPAAAPSTPAAPPSGAEAPKAAKATKGSGVGAQAVKAAQQALKDKGHDPGPIDGKMGPKTAEALKAFQKSEGLPETGRLDSATRGKLGV